MHVSNSRNYIRQLLTDKALVQDGPKDLHVFRGVPSPDLFAQQPHEVTVTMPAYDGYIWLLDVNKDSKRDILMHHTFPVDPQRVTLLISR